MYDSVQAHQSLNQAVNEVESLKTRLLNGISEHPEFDKVKKAFEDLEDIIGGTVGLVRDEASNSLVSPAHEAGKEAASQPTEADNKAVPRNNGQFAKKVVVTEAPAEVPDKPAETPVA